MAGCIDEIYFVSSRQTKKRFRRSIYEAWDSRCAYCGEVAKSLDHVTPRHKGGLTVIENLVPACLTCNGRKGAENWVVWYRKQEFYSVERETLIWLWINQHESTINDRIASSELFSLFLPVKQLDFLARFNVVDNTTFDNRALDCWLDNSHPLLPETAPSPL